MARDSAGGLIDAALRAQLIPLLAGRARLPQLTVAFSGGVDSTALLSALVAARWHGCAVQAVHFDHRLHPSSKDWLRHCAAFCRDRGIPLIARHASTPPPPAASIEAWAREQRYAVFADLVSAGDFLLTAHQRDDLAETILLMALRGSGPHGLAAIAPSRPLGAGTLLRPLLDLSRATLQTYLKEVALVALEDPANEAARYDRNFLRHTVLPLLTARWPAAVANLANVARLQRAPRLLLDAHADKLLGSSAGGAHRLDLSVLDGLAPWEQEVVLRRWLAGLCGAAPDGGILRRLQQEVVLARPDAAPVLRWHGGELRRYAHRIYWLARPLPALPPQQDWIPPSALDLPGGVLSAHGAVGAGLRQSLVAGATLTVRARVGGERLRPSGRAHAQALKHFLQERGIPPWERATLPLVYAGDELIAVADLCIAHGYAARAEEAGIVLRWLPKP